LTRAVITKKCGNKKRGRGNENVKAQPQELKKQREEKEAHEGEYYGNKGRRK
jgi:hypothetical protein